MSRKALITGITGQDGSYLAELLLSKGYEVHGLIRRVALEDPGNRLKRIEHIRIVCICTPALWRAFPVSTTSCVALDRTNATIWRRRALSAIRLTTNSRLCKRTSTGRIMFWPLSRTSCRSAGFISPDRAKCSARWRKCRRRKIPASIPRSAYGISKVAGFDLTRNYREAYGMHASSGILFNHESPRRGYRVRDAQDHLRRGQNPGRSKALR